MKGRTDSGKNQVSLIEQNKGELLRFWFKIVLW